MIFHLEGGVRSKPPSCRKYNSHQTAIEFQAQDADPEAPDLGFKDRKEMEKNLKCKLLKILLIFFIMIYLVSQHADGAAAAAGTNLLTKIQDECDVLGTTAKDYRNPSIEISDPRLEAALILEILKERLMNDWAKVVSDQVKIIGRLFNNLLSLRR